MIEAKNIKADFQMISSRVVKFELETREQQEKNEKVNVNNDFDYEIVKIESNDKFYLGVLQFKTNFVVKIKNKLLFKILVIYEGAFLGDKAVLSEQDFKNMLELNGIVTLSHLTRAFVISCSALAGINPPVRLPMINIHKLRKMKELNQSKENM